MYINEYEMKSKSVHKNLNILGFMRFIITQYITFMNQSLNVILLCYVSLNFC